MTEVDITDKMAIYVDGCRITHRGTKWGIHNSIAVFSCDADEVVKECLERGYGDHVKNIDTPPFKQQREAIAGLSGSALKATKTVRTMT